MRWHASEARVARRANAIVLLDDGWSCAEVAAALLIDDDSMRSWHKLYAEPGLTGLVVFHYLQQVLPDEAIVDHTRHRSLTTMCSYVRRLARRESPAGKLGCNGHYS